MCETLCVSCKTGVSTSPSPMELLQWRPADLQSQMLWGLFPDARPPAGEPDIGLRTHSCGRMPVIELVSCLWIAHSEHVGFDCIVSVPLLSSCCDFFFISLNVEYLLW